MSTEPIIDAITQRIMDDAGAYEPTPQEVRWALIEHQSRKLADALTRHQFVGVTGDALIALRDLREAMDGATEKPEPIEPDNPLAIIGNRGYTTTY